MRELLKPGAEALWALAASVAALLQTVLTLVVLSVEVIRQNLQLECRFRRMTLMFHMSGHF